MNDRLHLTAILILATVSVNSNDACAQTGRIVLSKQSPEATAEHLVNDSKFGGSSTKNAIEYGDTIIPLIKSESNNFEKLDNRNSFWIAKVLGSIDSDLARSTLKELYGRKDSIHRSVGAVGLAMHGIDIGPINDESFLVKIAAREAVHFSIGGIDGVSRTRVEIEQAINEGTAQELAVIALGYSKSEAALPLLHDALTKKRLRSDHVCEALARIKSPASIPVLQACLKDPEFHALSEAYRAATCLGDKEATHLAIERLGEDGKQSNIDVWLVGELRKVTGKSWWFSRYKKNWQRWWEQEGEKWTIPEEFLADWDKQPKMY